MRVVAGSIVLMLAAMACGDDAATPGDATIPLPDGSVDGEVPLEGGCPHTERTVLASSVGQVGFGPLFSDGDWVYYMTEGGALNRVHIRERQTETLMQSISTFTVEGDRVFVIGNTGLIAEVDGTRNGRPILQIGFGSQLVGNGKTLYYCDQNFFALGAFNAVDIETGSAVSVQTGSQLFNCVQGDGQYVYWPTGSDPRTGSATRVTRGGLGLGVTQVVDWPDGFGLFDVTDEAFALRTFGSIVLGRFEDEAPIEVEGLTANTLRISGDHVYASVLSSCTLQGVCAETLVRIALDGSEVMVIDDTQGTSERLTVDDQCAYWIENPAECGRGGTCTRRIVATPLTPRCMREGSTEPCDAGVGNPFEPRDGGPSMPEPVECGDAGEVFCVDAPDKGPLQAYTYWSMFDFGLTGHDQIAMEPIVTMLDDDNGDLTIDVRDIPDLVFALSSDVDEEIMIASARGDGGSVTWATPVAGALPNAGLAAGDIDGDGLVEIVGVHDSGIYVLENDGTEKYRNSTLSAYLPPFPTPTLANMDGIGAPEIVIGRAILNANGALRIAMPAHPNGAAVSESLPVDLDGDGIMELVFGNAAYDLDGALRWSRDAGAGFLAIANFDEDAHPEIVVVAENTVTLLDDDGEPLWSSPIDDDAGAGALEGGPPVIADFDGDALPEIGVASSRFYSMFDGDGERLWQVDVLDNSGQTGSTAFDFEADGVAEVVHGGTTRLTLLSGVDGTVRLSLERQSLTGTQSPVIADLTSDGFADIIVPWDGFASSRGGIDVYTGDGFPWAARTWNQHAYSIGNTLENGQIPVEPEASWLTHNTFRAAGVPRSRVTRRVCSCLE